MASGADCMTSCLGETINDILRSLIISGSAVLLATPFSLLAASHIVLREARTVERIINSLVGVPTVLIGLLLYTLLCSTCPLGWTNLLYTPQAIAIGEAILVTPIYTSMLAQGLRARLKPLYELAIGLGATRLQALTFALRESLTSILSASISAYSRAIGELGVALLVGGGIAGYTRTATVAIALEVSRGDFECAIQTGLMLVLLLAAMAAASSLIGRR